MIAAEIELACGVCGRTVQVPVTDLLVQVDADADPTGRLILDCPSCGDISMVEVCLRTVATLLLAGAVHVQHLRTAAAADGGTPAGSTFTAEDVCRWHALLRQVQTVEPWE
jgi:hypothetical protein